MTKRNETTQKKDKISLDNLKNLDIRIVLGASLIVAILIVAGVLLYHKIYYQNRWYKHTYINQVNVTGQTLEESKQTLENKFANYSITIKGRDDGKLVINGKDIDFTFTVNSEIDTLFVEQHEKFQLFSMKRNWTQKSNITYNESKLNNILTSAELIAGSASYKIVPPKSADVVYADEKQQYIIEEEIAGNKIITANLLTIIKDAILLGKTSIDLTDEKSYPNVYQLPKYTSESTEIAQELAACNNTALRYIIWNMGEGNVEQITPLEISKWITYKNGKIKLKAKKIENWVEKFCLKYKTVGITRKFKSHTGKMVKIKGGDYGWQIDYEKTLKQTKKALKASIKTTATNAYINNPNEETKKNISLRKKVIYANTAYKKDYINFKNDWDKKNYTEISIKDQKVYVFRNGKLKFSCRCITGRPVKDRQTPTGAFYIKEHREAYTLTGDDYSTPVKNWVRITWTGTGFHPATWQPWSRWTKTLYKTKGSHGCINLSVSDAKKIYDLVNYREMVFIH